LNCENKLKLFIDSKSINKHVKKIADKINKDYKGKVPVLIGVLNGAFVFLSDLVRKLNINTEIDFLKLSSYDENEISTGNIRLIEDVGCEISNRDILIVEDIIDSGLSVKFIHKWISKSNPKSLEFASLLYKKGLKNLEFDIKYIGFKIPDKFVVGYGLDYAQKYRNLKSIYFLKN
jgi:hypoxanthine phosphoribosyltransferase